jgi:hypothetical protein
VLFFTFGFFPFLPPFFFLGSYFFFWGPHKNWFSPPPPPPPRQVKELCNFSCSILVCRFLWTQSSCLIQGSEYLDQTSGWGYPEWRSCCTGMQFGQILQGMSCSSRCLGAKCKDMWPLWVQVTEDCRSFEIVLSIYDFRAVKWRKCDGRGW